MANLIYEYKRGQKCVLGMIMGIGTSGKSAGSKKTALYLISGWNYFVSRLIEFPPRGLFVPTR